MQVPVTTDAECLGGGHLVHLSRILLGSLRHPGVQLVAPTVAAVVAERPFRGLVEPGRVPVGRDREFTMPVRLVIPVSSS
jgi:hypothetical protein